MSPTHHPPEEELLMYATGTSPEWLSLMLACHLTLCARCRQDVSMLEELGGLLLQRADSVEAPAAPAVPAGSAPGRRAEPAFRPRLPEPLASRVPWPLQPYVRDTDPQWCPLMAGIDHIPLSLAAQGHPVRLVRLARGHVVPAHEHAGLEWVLVVDGTLDDSPSGARYLRGDVSRRECGTVHHQRAGDDGPCIALVAMTAPFIPLDAGPC